MAQVIIAQSAIEDLNRIAEYIALVNEKAAKNLVSECLRNIANLHLFPKIGSYPLELGNKIYRQLIVSPVRIFYRYEGSIVYVVHIFRMEMNITQDKIEN